MYRRLVPLLCLSAAIGTLSQCNKAPVSTTAPASEPALAVVAGRPITATDLREEAEWRKVNHQAVPSAEVLLNEMVQRLAMVERARSAGLEKEMDTRRRIESVLITRLRERELEDAVAKVTVSDEEVRASYEARKAEFSRKGVDRFALLFQALPAQSSEARKAEARQRLEAGLAAADANPAQGGRGPAAQGFGTIATEYSDDQSSRYRGGDIGWIETEAAETRWPTEVMKAGRALAVNSRSGIIEDASGLYVIMKTDARPGGARPFEEIAERLEQGLLLEKRRALEEHFVADTLAAAKVTTNPEAARQVTLPVTPAPAAAPSAPPAFPGTSRSSAAR
ncbi:peptidyl-prolyl cis-trans isomerase [Haloferula sp. BvORR071]|uniref:peptidylprolyl isomerase n=1 Tax=Haloferula sp. BvORR071 TaxID=1396141 RepID=UPI00054DC20B|nr:peptidyl-prolyl cis-trans isomerase [Haloferula sp. BvORR071]